MKSSTFLVCMLTVMMDGIFYRCQGRLNSSFPLSSSTITSVPSSPSWCSDCTSPTTLSNVRTAISPNRSSICSATNKMSSASVTMQTSVHPTSGLIVDSVSRTGAIVSSVGPITSIFTTQSQTRRPPSAPELSSFGIFLVTFGGVLVAFMIISLMWICCRGREKSPQAPHTQVKLKPWSRATDHSVDELTVEETDHPTSYQNKGLNSSRPNSPTRTDNKAALGTTGKARESRLI